MVQMNLQNRNRLTELDDALMVISGEGLGKGQSGSLGLSWTHGWI